MVFKPYDSGVCGGSCQGDAVQPVGEKCNLAGNLPVGVGLEHHAGRNPSCSGIGF